jgi:hypothetical protein
MLSHRIGCRVLLGTVGVLTLALFGCGGTSLTQPFGTNPNDVNKEREFNALVGAPSAAVNFVQRAVALNPTPLAFGQGDTYATVSSGISIVTDVFQPGTTTMVAPEASVTMTRNFFYTQVVTGIFGTTGATAPRQIQLTDNFPASVPTSSIALRLVNLSPDSPPITLYNTAGTPATAVGITGLGNVTYGNMSSSNGSNYVTAAAGNYNLSARDNAGNVLTTLGPVTLSGGHSYSVFVSGLVTPVAGQPAVQAILLTDQ